jgi:hypothetical protein
MGIEPARHVVLTIPPGRPRMVRIPGGATSITAIIPEPMARICEIPGRESQTRYLETRCIIHLREAA